MIAHLKRAGVEITRHDTFAALPFLVPARRASPSRSQTTDKPVQHNDRLAKLAERLKGKIGSRPRTKARLLARINADFGGKLSDTEKQAMLEELVRLGVLTFDATGKIVYGAQ